MNYFEIILFAASLCADCFAVALCSGVTIRGVRTSRIAVTALAFAVIQSSFMFAGWAFGDVFVGFISSFAHIVGFLLLLYVGGSMIKEGFEKEDEVRDLNGVRNVIIAGIATSIDALAVGVSLSMDFASVDTVLAKTAAVFVLTALSVLAGIYGGKKIGGAFGHVAEVVGGLVLVGIGVFVLIG